MKGSVLIVAALSLTLLTRAKPEKRFQLSTMKNISLMVTPLFDFSGFQKKQLHHTYKEKHNQVSWHN